MGVVKKPSGDAFVIADIPGLVEGASEGVGLGFEFLKHVERCRFLLHVVDASDENCLENYKKINRELENYSQTLSGLYQIVALNKIDLIDKETEQKLFATFSKENKDTFLISSATNVGIKDLLNFVSQKTEEIERHDIKIDVEEDYVAQDNDDSDFEVRKIGKNRFFADGGKIRRLLSVTDERNLDQLYRMQNILDSMGVFEKLKKLGLETGDSIVLGSTGKVASKSNISNKHNLSLEFVYFRD